MGRGGKYESVEHGICQVACFKAYVHDLCVVKSSTITPRCCDWRSSEGGAGQVLGQEEGTAGGGEMISLLLCKMRILVKG